MKDIIKKSINELKDISENIEQHFFTEFGKDFAENCSELEDYVRSGFMIPILSRIYRIIRGVIESEDVISLIRSLVNETSRFEPEQKQLALMGWEELHNEVKQDDGSFDKLEKQVSELQIINRMTEYYILKLYTYLDIYSMSLFQYIIANVETDLIFDILGKISRASTPLKMINSLLNSFLIKEETESKNKQKNFTILSELTEQISKTAFEDDLYYLEEFMNFRNIIAHRKKLASHDELEKAFPNLAKIANERLIVDTKKFRKR